MCRDFSKNIIYPFLIKYGKAFYVSTQEKLEVFLA